MNISHIYVAAAPVRKEPKVFIIISVPVRLFANPKRKLIPVEEYTDTFFCKAQL